MKYNKNEVTGKMRDRIILQNVNRSRSLTGFASESWADVATIWAFAESKLPGSNETIIEGKNTAKNICDFTIRYISSITEESRVVFKNKIYQVKNIKISHDRRFISFQGVYYDSYSTVFGLQFCSASLLAQSSLSAALMRVIKYQASLNAFGSVSADIALVKKVASSLNAFGTLTGDINFVQKAQASLLTSSSVTGNISIPKLVQASLTGAGTTTANLTVGADDAAAFFARVTAAGGTLTTTEQNAIITLVSQLKADGIWTKMQAIYPMVGASAASCAQNLKSASFTGTFSSGWTFANTGATPNGTSAYMNTFYIPSINGLLNSAHLSYYSRTNQNLGRYMLGSYENLSGPVNRHYFGQGNSLSALNSFIEGNYNPSSYSGFHLIKREISTQTKQLYNGAIITTSTINSTNRSSVSVYVAGANLNNTSIQQYGTLQCAFVSIGDGLTDTEATNLYTAVQAFQTTLNRQV